MTTTTPESRGRLAYTAYGREVDYKAYNGTELKPWDELPAPIRQAWIRSATAIWDLATTGRAEQEAEQVPGTPQRQREAQEHPDFEGDGPPVGRRKRVQPGDIPPVTTTARGVLAHARQGMSTTGSTAGITDVQLPGEPDMEPGVAAPE